MNAIAWLFSAADPFVMRLALLFAFFGAAALVDLAVMRRRATRWREYASIVLLGGVGAFAGILIDAATSTLSPDYFIYGKGLTRGLTLTREAMALGGRAGFTLGAVVAGLLCIANSPRADAPPESPPRLFVVSQRQIARAGLSVLAHVIVVALLFGAIATMAPLTAPDVRWAGPPTLARRFVVVWWIHLGAYCGALIGVVRRIVAIRRARRL